MSSYTLSHQAYLKTIFHAAQNPHKPVNGVLLGQISDGRVVIADTIPLLHHWTSLSPSMEIGLDLAYGHAESVGLTVVGYYQATERTDDTALAPVGERIASKIRERFSGAIALVIDGETLGSGSIALIPYSPSGSSWKKDAWTSPRFALASSASPVRALELIRDNGLHRTLADFDDHLEDVTLDWLRNPDCVDPAPPK